MINLPVNVAKTIYKSVSVQEVSQISEELEPDCIQMWLELQGYGLQAVFYKLNLKQEIYEIWCVEKETL